MFKKAFTKKRYTQDIEHSCVVRFLDDSEPFEVFYQRDTKGEWLLEHVCSELNLIEKAYFGLRFVDNNKQRHWLNPLKPVYRQLKNVTPQVLCFRVKFYPADPIKLKEEITKYYLFLQLRRDLHHGRLLSSPQDATLLAAYIVQSELGDFEPQDHIQNYVSQLKMLPKQTIQQEEKIAEIHKTLSGQVPSEAEENFLKKAVTLDTYGIDPHPVKSVSDCMISFTRADSTGSFRQKGGIDIVDVYDPNFYNETSDSETEVDDQKGSQMYIGVTYRGIITFQGSKRIHLFKWVQITKVAFEGRMFIIHVAVGEGEEFTKLFKRKKQACGFKCPTIEACKHLWKCTMEQKYFFTLSQSSEAPKVVSSGGFFTRGSKFRYSGRCQSEVFEESNKINRDPPNFERSSSNPQFVRNINHQRSATLPNKLNESFGGLTDNQFKVTMPTSDSIQVVYEKPDVTMNTTTDSGSEDERRALELFDDELANGSPIRVPVDENEIQEEIEFAKLAANNQEYDNEYLNESENNKNDTELVGEFTTNLHTKVESIDHNNITLLEKSNQDSMLRKSNTLKTCCLAAVLAFITSIVIVFILLIVTLEPFGESLPVLRNIRHWPEIERFQINNYEPVRNNIISMATGFLNLFQRS